MKYHLQVTYNGKVIPYTLWAKSPVACVLNWITFGRFVGITLGKTVHLRDRYPEPRKIRHEECHIIQVHRMGVIKFYASYLWLAIKHGYNKHPYEQEARRYAGQPER